MHGKLVRFDENELDQIVLGEFEKVERGVTPSRRHGEKTEEKACMVLNAVEESQAKGGTNVFSVEETSFIEDAVAWLGARENREIIVGEILKRLAETAEKPYPDKGDGETDSENHPPEASADEAGQVNGTDE
jgi:hypothetical protein